MPETNLNPQIVLTGVGMSATCGVAGYGGIAIQIQGSYTGTLTFEASVHGSEYEPMRVTKSDNSTPVTTTTTTGLYSASVSGYKSVRVRMSAHSLGSASVIMMAAPASTGGAGGGGGSGTDVNLIEVGGAAIALGETTMSASLPVVIASDQDPIPVTGSISATNPSVDATGDPVPADATFIGVSNASGDLTGLASVAVDLNSTTPPVVPVHGFYQALPGAGGPVVGGTATNPIVVGGTVANDSADTGNPIKVGAKAYSPDGTTPGTAVTEGDRSNAKSDLDGRLFVNDNAATCKTAHLDGSSAYTDQALIADPGDGFQVVITNIIGSTGAATALNFFLEEGSTKIFGPIYLEAVAGRGFASGPIYLPCTASTAVTLTSSASIAQSFQVNYFVQAV